jgi:hypothetical protein
VAPAIRPSAIFSKKKNGEPCIKCEAEAPAPAGLIVTHAKNGRAVGPIARSRDGPPSPNSKAGLLGLQP